MTVSIHSGLPLTVMNCRAPYWSWWKLWCSIHYVCFSISIYLTLPVTVVSCFFASHSHLSLLGCLIRCSQFLQFSLPVLFCSSLLYWPLNCYSCHISLSLLIPSPSSSHLSFCMFLIHSHSWNFFPWVSFEDPCSSYFDITVSENVQIFFSV